MKKQISILIGNTLDKLATLPEVSVHCVVTSPPYWGLRDYGEGAGMVFGEEKGCRHEWGTTLPEHHPGQVSDSLYEAGGQLAKGQTTGGGQFCQICGAWRGQFGLEPTPEIYVEHTLEFLRAIRRVLRNDGTLWWNIGDSYAGSWGNMSHPHSEKWPDGRPPQSYLVGNLKPKDLVMIPFRVALAAQADGWFVRSVIIWHKTNPMPESVKDRPTSSHEYVLLLTKSKKYFYDADAIREPHKQPERGLKASTETSNPHAWDNLEKGATWVPAVRQYNPAGRNKRTVWTISTKPFKGAHFATFPSDLIEPMVLVGCPEGGVVLDPFAGTGTVLEPCLEHGRRCILIDIDPRLEQWAAERKQKKEVDMAKKKRLTEQESRKRKANVREGKVGEFEQSPVYTGQYRCPDCKRVVPWTDWWWPRMYCTCGTKKKMEATRVPLAERGQKVCQRCHRPFTPSKFTPYQKYCPECGNRQGKAKQHGGKVGTEPKIKPKGKARRKAKRGK